MLYMAFGMDLSRKRDTYACPSLRTSNLTYVSIYNRMNGLVISSDFLFLGNYATLQPPHLRMLDLNEL